MNEILNSSWSDFFWILGYLHSVVKRMHTTSNSVSITFLLSLSTDLSLKITMTITVFPKFTNLNMMLALISPYIDLPCFWQKLTGYYTYSSFLLGIECVFPSGSLCTATIWWRPLKCHGNDECSFQTWPIQTFYTILSLSCPLAKNEGLRCPERWRDPEMEGNWVSKSPCERLPTEHAHWVVKWARNCLLLWWASKISEGLSLTAVWYYPNLYTT